jgi:hypothetical protein
MAGRILCAGLNLPASPGGLAEMLRLLLLLDRLLQFDELSIHISIVLLHDAARW